MCETGGEVPGWVIDWAEASRFLSREAQLLDEGRLEEWLQLLSPDIEYLAPVRATRYRGNGSEFSDTAFHFEEDLFSLEMRVKRLATRFAWAEDPPTRTRHFVANVRVDRDRAGLDVTSDLILHRSRLDEGVAETLTASRQDRLVRLDGAWRLGRRHVFLDETTLPLSTISTFL